MANTEQRKTMQLFSHALVRQVQKKGNDQDNFVTPL